MRSFLRSRIPGVLALAMLVVSTAYAQSGPAAPSPAFGTASSSVVRIGYGEFEPVVSTTPFDFETDADHSGRFSTTIGARLAAFPHLPTGAMLDQLELDFCDTDPTNHVLLVLTDCDSNGGNCILINSITSPNLGATHCGTSLQTLVPQNYTVQNGIHLLYLQCFLNSGSNSNVVNGAAISYHLQVSPAPAVATFADVPTSSPQFKFVEALVAAGITAGCGSGNYCPNDPITRGQMAVFLASALGLHFPG